MAKVLADGQVDIRGERASVKPKEGNIVELQRIDGKWRVDIGTLTKGEDVSELIRFLRAAGLSARQVADEIEAGRITSMQQVQEARPRYLIANLPRHLRDRLIPRHPTTARATSENF